MEALITDIKKFAVHDGDGIRTTVFFKGCPLKCVWCHNPETISIKPQIAFYEHKCIICGKCVAVCDNHYIEKDKHIFNRDNCKQCKKCVDTCPYEALEEIGKLVSIDDICNALLEDKDFYINSGGGVTLSGGECLLQAEACREILTKMKENGINTAVDTCGMVKWESIEKVIDYTDTFLYDIKAIDEAVHKKCTGSGNQLILENLKKIDEKNKQIEIRIPYVPDYNDNQIMKIADFISKLKNVKKVKILAYHNYAGSKYKALNMLNTLPEKMPSDEEIYNIVATLRNRGINCIFK